MQAREALPSAMRLLARPAALAPLTILGGIAVLLIAGGVLAPGFLALSNILLLLSLAAYLGIAAIGQTVVILTGGIDLSIAWTITGASIVFTGVTQGDDTHLWAGLAAALAVGIGAGFVNGVGVAKLKISPIVMTLGMNNIMQGLTLIYSQGTPSGSATDSVKWIATGWVGPAPVVVLVWIALGLIVSIGLHATRGGRYLYGVGESPVVSRLSGVDNDRVIIAAYAISGFLAALAGLVLIAYTNGSEARIGDSYLLPVMAVVVMGGTSLAGGQGNLVGTLAAALIMAVIHNGMNILAVPAIWQSLVVGLLIIGTVLADQWLRKKA
jgi:ribose transport system permease protein